MRVQVSAQLLLFGQSILLGLGLALLYDLLRPLRRRGRRLTALLDGAFCLAAGLTLLLLLVADSFFSVRLLRRTHNVDLLGIPNLLAALR